MGNVMFSFHYPVPFNVPGGSVGFRDDVGIVPYNHDEPRSIQRTGAVPYNRDGLRTIQRNFICDKMAEFVGFYIN